MEFLTLEQARELVGKKLRVLYTGYANQDGEKVFTLSEIVSEYELASRKELDNGVNQLNYWKTFMSSEQLEEKKKRFTLLDENGNDTFIRKSMYENCFWCGDSDRYVRFEVLK